MFGKISEVSTTVKNIEKVTEEGRRERKLIWKKVDDHETWMNRMKGSLLVITGLFGLIIYWCKKKLGGD